MSGLWGVSYEKLILLLIAPFLLFMSVVSADNYPRRPLKWYL